MRIRLKLSVSHDMDLITLSQSQFPLVEWLRICLKSYVEEGRITTIPLPAPPPSISCDKLSINFSLNDSKDQAVIKWLSHIRFGQRSGAIKSIFRCSLSAPCLYGHYDKADNIVVATPKPAPSVLPPEYQAIPLIKEENTPIQTVEPVIFTVHNRDATSEDDDFDILDFDPEDF